MHVHTCHWCRAQVLAHHLDEREVGAEGPARARAEVGRDLFTAEGKGGAGRSICTANST